MPGSGSRARRLSRLIELFTTGELKHMREDEFRRRLATAHREA